MAFSFADLVELVQFVHPKDIPRLYINWWWNLWLEEPVHLLVETLLLFALFWFVIVKRKPAKGIPLKEQEKEELILEWTPEPLVPEPDANKVSSLEPPVISKQTPTQVEINGNMVFNLASFDFLGLAGHPDVKETALSTLREQGCGSCGPRGFYGTTDKHLELETHLAEFMGQDECITYSDSTSTVASVIPAFAKRVDLLVVDSAVNVAVITGTNLARSRVLFFKHNDMEDLEAVLAGVAATDKAKGSGPDKHRRFIVVEGLYRDRGDICPLPQLLQLKETFGYRLIVDQNSSFGVLGETGRGISEHFSCSVDDIDITVAPLSTTLGSVGGFCAGTREVVDHQRLSGAGYCFSASAPPFTCACASAALTVMEQQPQLLAKLRSNSQSLASALGALPGVTLQGEDVSPIKFLLPRVPFSEARRVCEAIVTRAMSEGVLLSAVPAWVHPVARKPSNKPAPEAGIPARVRLSVNAALSTKQVAAVGRAIKAAVAEVMAGEEVEESAAAAAAAPQRTTPAAPSPPLTRRRAKAKKGKK